MIHQIIDSIDFYFYKLRLQIEELQSYSYFTEDQYKLISKLKKFNKKFQKKFLKESLEITTKLQSDNNDIEIYKDITRQISWYFQYFKLFNEYLSVIKTAENIKVNQGIYLLIENFTKSISERSRIIIFPLFKINCGYLDISNNLNKFTKVLKEKDFKDFLLFQIPTFNQNEILNNSILGHEIGHYIEEKYSLNERMINSLTELKVFTKKKIESIARSEFENKKKIDEDLEFEEYLFEYYNKWIEEKVVPWIKEIIADIIGLKLFGLAFFFACIDTISQTQSFGGKNYPPTSLRLMFLINSIKKSIFQYLNKFTLRFKNLKGESLELSSGLFEKIQFVEENYLEEEDIINARNKITIETFISTEFTKELDDMVDKLINDGIIQEFSFENEDNVKEIIYLMELLEEYIIPNEKNSKPVNIISIINAGWFFYLFNMNTHYQRFGINQDEYSYNMIDKKMLANQKLHNLLLKAIELSKLHEQLHQNITED